MQNAIDETLANLPIFVAGCNHFVVLAGATYTTRLWCLLEVFCFWRSRLPVGLKSCTRVACRRSRRLARRVRGVPPLGTLCR